MALSRSRPDRARALNRYAAVCFEVYRSSTVSINGAREDKGTEGETRAMRLLDEIKECFRSDAIVFGETFRGSGRFASCASDQEFFKVKLLLAELEPTGVRWELQVFFTVAGQSEKSLAEWAQFIRRMDEILMERLGAKNREWA